MSEAVLVFGANGQVGWELQRSMVVMRPVVALARNDVDLGSSSSIKQAIERLRPCAVVNAAAYTAVDKAEQEVEQAFALNAAAPIAMAEAARALDIPLIHFSSDYVYPGNKEGVYVETDATGPLSAYGRSKLAGDEGILASGANAVILRTSWVYAARGANFLKTMLRLAKERESLRVVADQVGAPTSAELLADVAAHVLKAMLGGAEVRGVYHCVAGGEISWHGYARYVFEQAIAAGHALKLTPERVEPIATSDYPTPAKRPLNSRLDCSKLEQTFGLNMPHWQVHVLRTLKEILA